MLSLQKNTNEHTPGNSTDLRLCRSQTTVFSPYTQSFLLTETLWLNYGKQRLFSIFLPLFLSIGKITLVYCWSADLEFKKQKNYGLSWLQFLLFVLNFLCFWKVCKWTHNYRLSVWYWHKSYQPALVVGTMEFSIEAESKRVSIHCVV